MAVEQIPANGSIRLSSFNLTLSANYFTQLTERLSGNLKIELLLKQNRYSAKHILSTSWHTTNGADSTVLPEMLAAFITPNHTAISPIIKRAAPSWGNGPATRLSMNIKAALRTG